MFIPRFNSVPVVQASRPKRQTVMYGDSIQIDPGFEDFGEALDCSVAPGLMAHFESSEHASDADLDEAIQRGEYYQQPLFEARADQ